MLKHIVNLTYKLQKRDANNRLYSDCLVIDADCFLRASNPHNSIHFFNLIRLVHNGPLSDSVNAYTNSMTRQEPVPNQTPHRLINLRPICLFRWCRQSWCVCIGQSFMKCSCALRRLLCQIC